MKKQIRTAKVFYMATVGEAEVHEGEGDCLALGIGTHGETVGVVEKFDSDVLERLRKEMEANPLGYVSVITLTGEFISDRGELDHINAMAGRNVDVALRGIYAVRYLDGSETKIGVKVSRNGRTHVTEQPRYQDVPLREFTCISCRNAGKENVTMVVNVADMEEVVTGNRTMTIASCPECDAIMTRTGKIMVSREMHGGLSERKMVFEPPETAYCFSCKRQVERIWLKSIRKTDDQPRPSYRGNCFRCLAMVGSPWQQTRLVPVKAETVKRLVDSARKGEDALYERRMKEAKRRHNQDRKEARRREKNQMANAMEALKARYQLA